MMSYEMVIVEDLDDAMKVATSGVFDFAINDTECENCGILVGPVSDTYLPCVVMIDNHAEMAWPICLDCAFPSVFPRFWKLEL